MKTFINGINIAYSDQGTGTPLIFLHAFPLNRTMWKPQEDSLSRQCRVVTVDLRGHGESDAPLWRFSLEQYADDVAGLMDHLSIQQAVLVGLSIAVVQDAAIGTAFSSLSSLTPMLLLVLVLLLRPSGLFGAVKSS